MPLLKSTTSLNEDGDYPIDEAKRRYPFSELWHEQLAYTPYSADDWQERDKQKEFAKRIYDDIFDNNLQKALNSAYEDGYDKGCADEKKDLVEDFRKLLLEAETQYPMSNVVDFLRTKLLTL